MISAGHSRAAGCVAIGKTPYNAVFVIPGLARNPVFFQGFTLLYAGPVIPDLIRDRHDGHKLSAFFGL